MTQQNDGHNPESDLELQERLRRAGVMQGQQVLPPPQQQKTVRKAEGEVIGGPVSLGEPYEQTVEELITNEAGTELRKTTLKGSCTCNRVLSRTSENAWCGVCGASLCEECSKTQCALDGCGKCFCKSHRTRIVEGAFMCVSHLNPGITQTVAAASPRALTPVASEGGSTSMVSLPPASSKGYPRLGMSIAIDCVGCGSGHGHTVILGSKQAYCHVCSSLTRITISQGFAGEIRVDTELLRDGYAE